MFKILLPLDALEFGNSLGRGGELLGEGGDHKVTFVMLQ